jgi:photosystem II stability/assembly factor-like uncharacterized protein
VAISTADAGRSWNTVSLPDDVDPATLDCPGPTTCWVAGATGGFGGGAAVDVSHDNGRTWQPSSIPGDLPGVVAMSCSSPSDCVAVTVQAERASDPTLGSVVLRLVTASARGRWEKVGTIAPTWAPVGAGDTLAASPDLLRCQTGRECLLATASESGGAPQWRGRILRTTDGGRTWAVAGRSPDNDQSLAGVVCPGLGECVGVGSGPPNKGAGIVVTDGRGSHPVVGTVPAGVGNLYGVTCTSTERCVAVGTTVGAAAVLVTDDAGKSWSAATVPAYVTG